MPLPIALQASVCSMPSHGWKHDRSGRSASRRLPAAVSQNSHVSWGIGILHVATQIGGQHGADAPAQKVVTCSLDGNGSPPDGEATPSSVEIAASDLLL